MYSMVNLGFKKACLFTWTCYFFELSLKTFKDDGEYRKIVFDTSAESYEKRPRILQR